MLPNMTICQGYRSSAWTTDYSEYKNARVDLFPRGIFENFEAETSCCSFDAFVVPLGLSVMPSVGKCVDGDQIHNILKQRTLRLFKI
jgi:hypothetical protein